MHVTPLDDGVRVTDDAKNTIRVRAADWEPADVGVSVAATLNGRDVGPDDPSVVIGGRATRVEFPPVFVAAIPLTGEGQREFGGNLTELSLPDGEYLLRIDASVRVFLRVTGSMELHRESGEALWIEFPDRQAFELAFASHVDRPDGTVTVPKTPDGVARALSVLSGGNDTTSPDRTWPTMRGRAPLVRFGDTVSVPNTVATAVDETGIEVIVPPSLDALVPIASLVHYLGATVSVESDVTPRVTAGATTHELGDVASLPRAAADLLCRVFYLDCVARGAGPHGGTLSVADTFDQLGLDAQRLYEASLSERLQTYLSVDFESVRSEFPEWHLSMYVEPTYEHAATLPYLVDNVPFIFEPVGEPISEQEWLQLSLTGGGFSNPVETRSQRSSYGRREVSNIDLLQPTFGPGRTHGWLADGVPVGAFKTTPEAYRHRDDALDDPGERLSVTAVVNETDVGRVAFASNDGIGMQEEHEAAVDHYRTRAEQLNADIAVRENVTTGELARIFESHNDLVHFIGHHEDDGLDCTNGFLSADTLDRSRSRTFFLNACGSYPFGRELIRNGSVAGGVTFASVSDSDAANVGTTFARMLMLGYSINRGLAKAARFSIAPRDYAVIGDGTFQPSQSNSIAPLDAYVVPNGADSFQILLGGGQTPITGAKETGPLNDDEERKMLSGQTRLRTVDLNSLLEFLHSRESPVVFRRELYWPGELIREIST